MNPDLWQDVARQIHGSGRLLAAAVTGGGSGALAALLQTPGASRSILEAVVPYSAAALAEWIGGPPEGACSEATARAMAMAAWARARRLAPEADPQRLVGVGATASLASDRPKRGPRRIHVGVQTATSTTVRSLALVPSSATRTDDEQTATSLLLWAIAEACEVDAAPLVDSLPTGRQDELLTYRGAEALPEQTELLLGARRRAVLRPNSAVNYFEGADAPALPVAFPGAFHPPHAGHLRMAEFAEARLGKPLAWELSIQNVDKPPLDFLALGERIRAIRFEDGARPIALTRAPTFREKAALFPGATFVVGADTIQRIVEPRYYGDDAARRDAAIRAIASHGCRFLVFGRALEGKFRGLSDLALPTALRDLCDEVSQHEFREDVSSTELRKRDGTA